MSVFGLAVISGLGFLAFLFLTDDSEPLLENVSVDELYKRVDASLHEQEGLYYARIDFEGDGASYRLEGTIERWVDARENIAREETKFVVHLPSGESRSVEEGVIYTENGTYSTNEGQVSESPPRDCGGARLSTSIVLGCNRFLNEVTTTTELGSFEGQKAVVFVREGISIGSDETTSSTERTYLDLRTFLPFSAESAGRSPSQGEFISRHSYEMEWIPRNALPQDFFSPSAIGFDREAAIRGASDLQVYWLGSKFEASGVEPLVLKSTYAAPGRGGPYRYSLTYASASNPHEPPFLILQVFLRDEWEKVAVLPNQAAVIGDTVVFFGEAKAQEGPNTILTPEALEELKAGLRPYE